MKRALILSGGGLFGAWQVGAWSVLRDHFEPDVIVGASIGSLNGWAIAGGCTPEDLEARWHEAATGVKLKFRIPRRPLDGLVEPTQIEGWIRRMFSDFQPKVEFHAVITDLLRMTPQLVDGRHMHWQHLAASCAMLGLLPQRRIDRVLYTDGGIVGALPLWAAVPVQATHVVALNVTPRMPWAIRAALQPFRASRRKPAPKTEWTHVLAPSKELGSWKDAFLWQRAHVDDWVELGRRDARDFLSRESLDGMTGHR